MVDDPPAGEISAMLAAALRSEFDSHLRDDAVNRYSAAMMARGLMILQRQLAGGAAAERAAKVRVIAARRAAPLAPLRAAAHALATPRQAARPEGHRQQATIGRAGRDAGCVRRAPGGAAAAVAGVAGVAGHAAAVPSVRVVVLDRSRRVGAAAEHCARLAR